MRSVLLRAYFWIFSRIGRGKSQMGKKNAGTMGMTAEGVFADEVG
jgi:hypothetical protein